MRDRDGTAKASRPTDPARSSPPTLTRPLDTNWVDTWRENVARVVSRTVQSFEEIHGYPPGENTVVPAGEDTRSAARALAAHPGVPPALMCLYSALDSLSLPDVGNGYFIHPPATVTAHMVAYGSVRLAEDDHGVVFGSDGGGILFAIGSDGRVHRSLTASWADTFEAVAPDLHGFLVQLRHAAEESAAMNCLGRL